METNKVNPDVNILNKEQIDRLLNELNLPKEKKTKKIPPKPSKEISPKKENNASVSDILRKNFIMEE